MKDLIRKTLLEHVMTYDTLSMLSNYEGENKVLQQFKYRLNVLGKPLTEKQKEYAISLLKKEYYESSIYEEIKNSKVLRNLIVSEGIKTYKTLIRTSKRKFFNTNKNSDIKVDKPSTEWVQRNIKDLQEFIRLTKDSSSKFYFEDRDVKLTTHQEANLLLGQLEDNDFLGFLEKKEDGEGYEWSILNRIGSHWTNWAKMIAKRDINGELGEGTTKNKIENYFEPKKIEYFYKGQFEELDDELKYKIWKIATNMSYAEFDIIESFIEHQQQEPTFGPAIDTLENIMNRIHKTTKAGDIAEENFINWLINEKGISDNDIYNFSSFGNLVDITFQVDLIVRLKGNWVPIQVKNTKTTTKLLKYGIGGILVYPTESSKVEKYGQWTYETSGTYPRSFESDFID